MTDFYGGVRRWKRRMVGAPGGILPTEYLGPELTPGSVKRPVSTADNVLAGVGTDHHR